MTDDMKHNNFSELSDEQREKLARGEWDTLKDGTIDETSYVDSDTIMSLKLPKSMTDTKPKFSDLKADEVNCLIATRIMGWHLNHSGLNWWDEGHTIVALRYFGSLKDHPAKRYQVFDYPSTVAELGTIIFAFDPYNSLDDCWKVEEALYKTVRDKPFEYANILFSIIKGDRSPMEHTFNYLVTHGTPQQKCEAMLRAIGEVE